MPGMFGLLRDSFENFMSGLGVRGRDKTAHTHYTLRLLNMRDLQNAYRGSWLARKIIDIPAFDMTRAWRTWSAQQEDVSQIADFERKFGLQRKVMLAIRQARLYGGAGMIMGIRGQKFEEALDLDSIDKEDLVFVHVVERWMLPTGPLIRDVTSPWFGQPEYYMFSNVLNSPTVGFVQQEQLTDLGVKPGATMMIHPSRVVRFLGNEYPDLMQAQDAWGDSVLQTVDDAVKDAGLVGMAIANLVTKASRDVIKVPGLTNSMSSDEGTQKLVSRFAGVNVASSLVNATLLDKNEDWTQLQASFGSLPQVHQMFLIIACGAADIPSTRLLGREPAGQNATGDADTRNYYDRLSSEQNVKVTPALSPLDEVMLRSIFGERDPDLTYAWNPLWQLSETERSDVILKKAQAYKIDVDTGQIPPEVLAQVRTNQLTQDQTYPGLAQALDDYELLQSETGEDVDEADLEQQTSDADGGAPVGMQSALSFMIPGKGAQRVIRRRKTPVRRRAVAPLVR